MKTTPSSFDFSMDSMALFRTLAAGKAFAHHYDYAITEAGERSGIGHGEHGRGVQQDPVKAGRHGIDHLGKAVRLEQRQRIFDAAAGGQQP